MKNTKENNHNNSEQIFENSLDNKNNNLPDAFWSAYNNYKGIEDPANTIWYTLGAFVTNWLS